MEVIGNIKYITGVTEYVVDNNDGTINVDTSVNAVTIILPNILSSGYYGTAKGFIINDISNNASVNNIIIVAADNIVNSTSSIPITQNGGTAKCSIANQNEWFVVREPESFSGSQNWTTGSGLYSIKANNNSALDATGDFAVAEGLNTTASGEASRAEGGDTIASGSYSHAEGNNTISSGEVSHAEGLNTTAGGEASHAEGSDSIAIASYTHSEGLNTRAGWKGFLTTSVINGVVTISGIGDLSSEFGTFSYVVLGNAESNKIYNIIAQSYLAPNFTITLSQINSNVVDPKINSGDYVANYNNLNTANVNAILVSDSGNGTHSEGALSKATGFSSHAEGKETFAGGGGSHAEGIESKAYSMASHAGGIFSISQHFGEWCRSHNGTSGQYGIMSASAYSTNANPFILNIQDASDIFIPNNTVYKIKLECVLVNPLSGDAKEFSGGGLIKNISGITSLVGAFTMTSTNGDVSLAATSVTVTADNVNDCLQIECVGISGNLRWFFAISYTLVISK